MERCKEALEIAEYYWRIDPDAIDIIYDDDEEELDDENEQCYIEENCVAINHNDSIYRRSLYGKLGW